MNLIHSISVISYILLHPKAERASDKMFSKPSPIFARKGHQQITGSEADDKDRIIAGVQFIVRYIGSTEVACANGTGSGKTEKPVAQVFDQQRKSANGKTHKKMVLTLCSKNVTVSDEARGKLVASFPISKITFCNIDIFYEKAFVFVARDKPENPFKAFVFTCESKTKAKEAFKALSLAFIINYECYQASLTRAALNGKAGEGGSALNSREPENTFFNGVTEAGCEIESAQGNSKKGELLLHCSDAMPLRKDSCPPVVNGFRPTLERISTPPPARPIQNKSLLQVADCRRHVRSFSDPTQFGKTTNPSRIPSPLLTVTPAPQTAAPKNNVAVEVDDPEFTEFAELRSKCRSSSSAVVYEGHPGSVREDIQRFGIPNIWGDFQKACPPIY